MKPHEDSTEIALESAPLKRRRITLVWVAFWLALILAGAKAVSLGVPHSWRWMLDLSRVTFRDVLFALSLGVIGEAIVLGLSRRPRISRTIRAGVIVLCLACAFYSVAAYGVFEAFDRPLSFDILKLMRGAAVKSSITDRLTWQITLAFVAVPIAFCFAVRHASRGRAFSPVILGCMAAWVAVGAAQPTPPTAGRKAQRLGLSPHVELLRSTVAGFSDSRKNSLPREFPPEYQDELQVFGKRGNAPRTGFQTTVERPRNVIVIVLESVGTKYLNLYGSPYNATPNLLAESRHALVFDNFYAHAPYTFCSFMALNFSIYPGLPWCYAPGALAPDGKTGLPPTFASVMQRRGSRTAYFHNGNMDWGGEKVALTGSGYDTVEDYRDFNAPELTSWGSEDRYLIDRLIRWIDEKPGQPFLAYIWTDQTHNPYMQRPGSKRIDFFGKNPPPAHPGPLSRYLNVLHETDGHLGRLFAVLRERGLADDTLVVLTGDHGEAFGDPHDQQGHGFSVYQEEIAVPLMIWNPRLFPTGGRIESVGGHVDLNPTVADILAVEIPDTWQGHSLFEKDRPNRTFLVASVDDYIIGIREDRWKYIFEASGGRESLFDLSADPDEQRNVESANPDLVFTLRRRMAAWIAFEDEFLATPGADSARR